MKKLDRLIGAALIASALIGCGGGDKPAASGPSPAPGTLLESSLRASHAAPEIEALRATSPLAGSADPAACGVDVRHLVYSTLDPLGQAATASAAVMVPTGTGATCSGARPLLQYAHGTTVLKIYDMADPAHNDEARAIEAVFAAQGYIVIAPNYLGYDVSSLGYHPCLNADVQAGDMIDGLTAGIAALAGAPTSGLYVADHSQGFRAAYAGSAFRDDPSRNTLLGWNPKAPTALCGGIDDPTAYFSNAGNARDDFASLPEGSSYTEIYDSFKLAKAAAGANWQMKYHGELVPPACYALARGFFATHGAGQ